MYWNNTGKTVPLADRPITLSQRKKGKKKERRKEDEGRYKGRIVPRKLKEGRKDGS